jgi:hypothetical protein
MRVSAWMYRRLTAVAVVASFFVVASSSAPAAAQVRQGAWEATITGSGNADNSLHNGGIDVTGSVGYFLTDQFMIGLRQNVGYVDTGADNAFTATTRAAADWHFLFREDQKVIPFVGATLGYLYGDVRDQWIAGPEAGVKWFLNESTFLYGTVAYDFLFRNPSDAGDAFDDGRFVYGVGIGFTW